MSVAKLQASDTLDVMRTEDGIETIIRQAIGKEPFFYFPRVSDSSGQLIPFLHAFDPQGVNNVFSEYPGWPLLYPLKVPTEKCEKCSQEFCSTLNYRRHLPVHHRFKKLDKDTSKTRELLGAYWDKLSVEEAKEVVSFENVMLEEVTGSSVLHALIALTQKQGFFFLLPCYLRAGGALLDIVQSKPSSFPIPSQELFSILDDASEGTFLLGTTASMQKSVFPGGAEKIGLEPKNVVACSSFLLEQILVKAWLADKDAEALRCQKQLVEEEEAAQKRQAEILKRKRQKKLRQKEQKAKEQRNKLEVDTKENIDSTMKTVSPEETSLDTYDFEAQNPEESAKNTPDAPLQSPDIHEGTYEDTQSGHDFGADLNIQQSQCEVDYQSRAIAIWHQLPKFTQYTASDQLTNKNPPILNSEVIQKDGTRHDQRTDGTFNAGKAWPGKPKPEIDTVVLKTVTKTEPDLVNDHEVLIGTRHNQRADGIFNAGKAWPGKPKPEIDTVVLETGTKTEPDLVNDHEVLIGTRHNPRADGTFNAGKAWQPKPEIDTVVLKTVTKTEPDLVNDHEVLIGTRHNQRADDTFNAGKAWSGKPKPEIDTMVLKTVTKTEPDLVNDHEVLIGSISVNLANCSQSESNVVASQEKCLIENEVAIQEKCLIENTVDKQNSSQNKPKKPDLRTSENNQSIVKPSTAVSQFETKDPFPVQSGGLEDDAVNRNEVCQNLSRISSDGSGFENKVSNTESRVDPVKQKFSIQAARDFLAKRWEEALSSEHVELVISLDSELSENQEAKEDDTWLSTTKASKSKCRGKAKKGTNHKERTTQY